MPPDEQHNIDQLWTNVRQTQNQVAGMEAKIDGLNNLSNTVSSILNRPHKEFDYKGIILIALAVAGMAGGLVAATIAPMRSTLTKHDQQIVAEISAGADQSYKAGVRDGKLETIEAALLETIKGTHTRLNTLEYDSATTMANSKNLARWIQAVDLYRSRGHTVSAGSVLMQMEKEKTGR